ncbi:MAG: hypothetical protein Q7S44_00075 [bacterium]|nr:hypothetical protein [bacterium]
MKKIPVALSLGVATLLLSVTSVLAVKPDITGAGAGRATITPGVNTVGKQATAPGKLKACQAREAVVKNRSAKIVGMMDNMLTKFSSISGRVQNFYTNKVVPGGQTVENYDTLVADIQNKQASAQAALQTAKNDAAAFSCTSGTPRDQMTAFRKDMQAVKTALKDFRTSVRNLIVAVHSVTGAENSAESGGGRPSITPGQGQTRKATITPGAKGKGAGVPTTTQGSEAGQ